MLCVYIHITSCRHFGSRASVFLPSHLSQTLGGGGALCQPTRCCWVADCVPDGCLPLGLALSSRLACLWPSAYGASRAGCKFLLWCPVPWFGEVSLEVFGTCNGGVSCVGCDLKSPGVWTLPSQARQLASPFALVDPTDRTSAPKRGKEHSRRKL